MGNIEWTEDKIINLGKLFLGNVLKNMNNFEDSTVSFGKTGMGIKPNYQVKFLNGDILTINGASHKQFSNAEKFNDYRISQPFTFGYIKQCYEKA